MFKRSVALMQVTLVGAFAADLPIREVILYKHGVAYFQRAGELKPGETARLDFKAADMNDVLKSLTITDRNGGKIGGAVDRAAQRPEFQGPRGSRQGDREPWAGIPARLARGQEPS